MNAPHRPAAFINAIYEEGTKQEAVDWLQKTWNEHMALVDAVRALYFAAYWHADRPVNEIQLWTVVRDAASIKPGQTADLLGPDRSASSAGTTFTEADFERMWLAAAGSFHGPNVETGTMPKANLMRFLRELCSVAAKQSASSTGEGMPHHKSWCDLKRPEYTGECTCSPIDAGRETLTMAQLAEKYAFFRRMERHAEAEEVLDRIKRASLPNAGASVSQSTCTCPIASTRNPGCPVHNAS